jgi:hypothetical protein
MQDSKVVIVHLRRPNQRDKKEKRSDPFYEFGSFGCTGCHNKNLMNPKKIKELDGVKLAFAQGGGEGFKLILLTPPVKIEKHLNCCEAHWEHKNNRPFKYHLAPLLIDKGGHSDFPFLKKILQKGKRFKSTREGQFSSNFRSRRRPLDPADARKLIKIYSRFNKTAKKGDFARNYVEAMHKQPPKPDDNRKETYKGFRRKAKNAKHRICGCRRKPY